MRLKIFSLLYKINFAKVKQLLVNKVNLTKVSEI